MFSDFLAFWFPQIENLGIIGTAFSLFGFRACVGYNLHGEEIAKYRFSFRTR